MARSATWLAEELAGRIRRLRPEALVEVIQPGEVQLRLAPRQEPVRVYAARAAGPCAIDGDFCELAIDRLAQKAIEVAEHEIHPIDRDRILPRIVDSRSLEGINNLTEDTLVAVEQPLIGDLRVVYGYRDTSRRRPQHVTVRKRDLVRRLNLDPQRLHDLAVANLARVRQELRWQPIAGTPGAWQIEGAPEQIVYQGRPYLFPGDVLPALALDALWEDADRTMQGEIVVLVLADSLLVATTAERRAIAYLVEQSGSRRGITMSPTLLIWRGGWQIFQP